MSYGTSTGQLVAMVREILKRKGQKFDAYYSVIMPDTWTPIFNLTNKERRRLYQKEITKVCGSITVSIYVCYRKKDKEFICK